MYGAARIYESNGSGEQLFFIKLQNIGVSIRASNVVNLNSLTAELRG